MEKSVEQIRKEIEALKTDQERWEYLLANKKQKHIPTVLLDNDATFMATDYCEDDEWNQSFDYYIGWAEGIETLLMAVGIKAECV